MNKFLSSSIAALALTAAASAAIVDFDILGRSGAGMRFDNENPGSSVSTATGGEVFGGITFDDVANLLILNVGWGTGKGFTDLTGNVTAAHIHAAGGPNFQTTNGGVIISLDGLTPGFSNSSTNGGWTNTQVTLTAAQKTQLFNGQLYLNAHTAANGGGELRGNLVQAVPEPSALGLLAVGATGALLRRRRVA